MSNELSMRQRISIYHQELLEAQYKVSAKMEHGPTKGELREQFIKRLVCEQYEDIRLYKGILEMDGWQSPEIDFIWLKQGVRTGPFSIYDGRDCKLYMEI